MTGAGVGATKTRADMVKISMKLNITLNITGTYPVQYQGAEETV